MPFDSLKGVHLSTQRGNPNPISIPGIPEDQMAALVRNLANATISAPACSLVVERNFRDLQRLKCFLNTKINFKLYDLNQKDYQELTLQIKAPEVGSDLPIFFREDLTDTIGLSDPLPFTLQESMNCATILDLLKTNFPKLTASSFFNKETKIPRFVVSSPIPLNQEDKGNFFPQIKSEEGEIAYLAWDSSGSQIAKGFKENTCDILFDDKEAFCGVALSQDNLKGIEKGAGVSAHFMTSKVIVIGILVTKSPTCKQSLSWYLGGERIRLACEESDSSDDDNLSYDSGLIARGPSSRSDLTTFGMLGIQGAAVASYLQNLPDRSGRSEVLHPFCLEIVPQFSSEQNPVQEDDLIMAIDMQFQRQAFAGLSKS